MGTETTHADPIETPRCYCPYPLVKPDLCSLHGAGHFGGREVQNPTVQDDAERAQVEINYLGKGPSMRSTGQACSHGHRTANKQSRHLQSLPRGPKYPISEVSASKNHTLNCI